MGETPEIPDSLSEEGKEFLQLCFVHDPSGNHFMPGIKVCIRVYFLYWAFFPTVIIIRVPSIKIPIFFA